MPWWVFAFVSAVAAAATTILAKVGVEGIPSNLATAVRTAIVLVFAWGVVFAQGDHHAVSALRGRPLVFLALSGVATALSWLAYFRALQLAPASHVSPIDKLSLPLTIVLAALLLGEVVGWKAWIGVAMMTVGAILTIS